MPLINCEVSFILNWSENCVLTSKATGDAVPAQVGNSAVAIVNNSTNVTSNITDTKLYVPVVTLLTEDDSKLLQHLKTRFKRTVKLV